MRGGQVADHGRFDVEAAREVTLGQVFAAGEDGAVAARLRDRRLMAIDRALIDDRAEPVGPDERIADGDLLGLLDQQADELVVDRALDIHARVRRALLATEPKGAAHDPLGRFLEVGLARDDGRVLAAHLDDAGRGQVFENAWKSRIPTSYEPVKTMPSMPG